MRAKEQFDWPFTKREWRHLTGTTAADWFAYLSLLLSLAIFFYPNSPGDVLLAVSAIAASLISFVVGWRHEPDCSDFANAMNLVCYPLVPLMTIVIVGVHYLFPDLSMI